MEEFDLWNQQKKQANQNSKQKYFKERDVFFCRVGKNIGHEQNGSGEKFLRPVIVVRKFTKNLFWGVPTTTKPKFGSFYHKFMLGDTVDYALLPQLKLFDTKRIAYKVGQVAKNDFKIIKEKTIMLMNNGCIVTPKQMGGIPKDNLCSNYNRKESKEQNNFLQLCQNRRSVHHYLPNKKIDQITFKYIFDCVRLTPSGYNCQPWEFLVIEDESKRKKIQELSFGQKHITECSAIIFVLGDANIARNARAIMDEWVALGHAEQKAADSYYQSMIKERPLLQRKKMALRSTSLAAMTLMYAATEQGLATCPMMGFQQKKVAEYLELPEDIFPVLMMAIGYEDASKRLPRLPRKKVEDMVKWEKY
jgi:putative NAD(P)H nitroreductase